MVLSLFFYGYKGSENTPLALSTSIKTSFRNGVEVAVFASHFLHTFPPIVSKSARWGVNYCTKVLAVCQISCNFAQI